MGRRTKKQIEEASLEFTWTKYWASVFQEDLGIAFTNDNNQPRFVIDASSGFRCSTCDKDILVFLQGSIIPASQYPLWCKTCCLSMPILHEDYLPYLERVLSPEDYELVRSSRRRRRPVKAIEEGETAGIAPDEVEEPTEETEEDMDV